MAKANHHSRSQPAGFVCAVTAEATDDVARGPLLARVASGAEWRVAERHTDLGAKSWVLTGPRDTVLAGLNATGIGVVFTAVPTGRAAGGLSCDALARASLDQPSLAGAVNVWTQSRRALDCDVLLAGPPDAVVNIEAAPSGCVVTDVDAGVFVRVASIRATELRNQYDADHAYEAAAAECWQRVTDSLQARIGEITLEALMVALQAEARADDVGLILAPIAGRLWIAAGHFDPDRWNEVTITP